MPKVHNSIVSAHLTSSRIRKCDNMNKIIFDSEYECLLEANRLFIERGGPKLKAYRCSYCQRWHFTSN